MKASGHSHEKLLESYSCRGRVAQLREHLLCKHAFISPKSLNRRLLTVQIPLLVGLLIGLKIINNKDTLSKFGQTLRKMDSIRVQRVLPEEGPRLAFLQSAKRLGRNSNP